MQTKRLERKLMNWRWRLPHRVSARLETSDLGQSFAKAVATMSASEAMNFQTYPVAVAAACQKACIDKRSGLLAYLQAFSNNLIAVAVRLVPLGQTKGLEVMRDLMPVISTTAERALDGKP